MIGWLKFIIQLLLIRDFGLKKLKYIESASHFNVFLSEMNMN